MTLTLNDWNGIEIEVGDIVAYNYSGDVVKGEVTRIFPGTRYGRTRTYFNVRNLSKNHYGHGKISKVTRPTNLMVIHKVA